MRLGAWQATLKKHAELVIVGLVLIAVLTLATIFWAWPSWQTIRGIPIIEDRVRLKTELVKTLAQIALGGLVLGTLWVARQRVIAAVQAVEVAREGQITERFTRATEQLGNQDSTAIRLGGIYALERIAKDSPKDHWQVMEVLTAYMRESKWLLELPDGANAYRRVPTDIQAILNVLRRRNIEYESPEHKLDLSGANLMGADLGHINLQGANLFETSLQEANLIGASLTQTNLRHTNLFHANLTDADLREAYLGEVHPKQELTPASSLSCASLKGANLRDAKLEIVDFGGADLQGAILTCADLQYANFTDAQLQKANLAAADLRRADFTRANLQEADLTQTDFRMASNLTQEQIDSAVTNASTILPKTLKGGHSL